MPGAQVREPKIPLSVVRFSPRSLHSGHMFNNSVSQGSGANSHPSGLARELNRYAGQVRAQPSKCTTSLSGLRVSGPNESTGHPIGIIANVS
jgi:hypothetical protein